MIETNNYKSLQNLINDSNNKKIIDYNEFQKDEENDINDDNKKKNFKYQK